MSGRCYICGLEHETEDASVITCVRDLQHKIRTLEAAAMSPTDPTGVELVNRFNAMSEALRAYADIGNWHVWKMCYGDANEEYSKIVLWSPNNMMARRGGDIEQEKPWLIAQKALGMVEGKA